MSNIPEHFLKKIQEAKEKQLKELNLSCGLNTPDEQKLILIPAEVFVLEQLEVLNFYPVNPVISSKKVRIFF
jgi:hypothetical protein